MDAAFDTPRLHLRLMDERDEALYCRLYADPEVMRHIAAPLSAEAARRSFRAGCRQQSARVQRWIVCERASDDCDGIGLVGLFLAGDEAELGIMLLARAQGRGYAAEAIAGMTDRVFASPTLQLLRTRQAPGNTAVVALMRRLGFEGPESELEPAVGSAGLQWRMTRVRWLGRGGVAAMAASVRKR